MYIWPGVRCIKITEIWVYIHFYIHLTLMSQLDDILAHSSKDRDNRNYQNGKIVICHSSYRTDLGLIKYFKYGIVEC